MYNEKYEEIDEIVESIRKNSKIAITYMNGYVNVITYKQPSMKKQLNMITNLINKNINIKVINAPIGLGEIKDKDIPIEVKSVKYTKDDEIKFNEKSKSVFFYTWIESNKVENNEFMGMIRFAEYENEIILKDLSVKV